MEGSLRHGPLCLPFFSTVILLGGEGSLKQRKLNQQSDKYNGKFGEEDKAWSAYLPLDEGIPCLSTENVADGKLQQVERNKEDDTVEPDDSSPAPATTFNFCKVPVGIDSDKGCNLRKERIILIILESLKDRCVV